MSQPTSFESAEPVLSENVDFCPISSNDGILLSVTRRLAALGSNGVPGTWSWSKPSMCLWRGCRGEGDKRRPVNMCLQRGERLGIVSRSIRGHPGCLPCLYLTFHCRSRLSVSFTPCIPFCFPPQHLSRHPGEVKRCTRLLLIVFSLLLTNR